VLHRLHHRVARLHHAPADLTAKSKRELLGRLMVGAESTFQDQPGPVVEGETSDLGRRRFGRAREHLLQHLIQIERRSGRLQSLLEVAQLPDASLVLLVQLRVAHRNHALIAQRGQHALVVRGPLARLGVEDGERSPETAVLEHRRADRGLDAEGLQVGR